MRKIFNLALLGFWVWNISSASAPALADTNPCTPVLESPTALQTADLDRSTSQQVETSVSHKIREMQLLKAHGLIASGGVVVTYSDDSSDPIDFLDGTHQSYEDQFKTEFEALRTKSKKIIALSYVLADPLSPVQYAACQKRIASEKFDRNAAVVATSVGAATLAVNAGLHFFRRHDNNSKIQPKNQVLLKEDLQKWNQKVQRGLGKNTNILIRYNADETAGEEIAGASDKALSKFALRKSVALKVGAGSAEALAGSVVIMTIGVDGVQKHNVAEVGEAVSVTTGLAVLGSGHSSLDQAILEAAKKRERVLIIKGVSRKSVVQAVEEAVAQLPKGSIVTEVSSLPSKMIPKLIGRTAMGVAFLAGAAVIEVEGDIFNLEDNLKMASGADQKAPSSKIQTQGDPTVLGGNAH